MVVEFVEFFVDFFGDFGFAENKEKKNYNGGGGNCETGKADSNKHTNSRSHPDVGGGGEAVDVFFGFNDDAGA